MSRPALIETRADLERYIACFNAKDYTGQIAHYAPDVEYKVGTLTLTSPDAIAEFYRDFHGYCDEHVVLKLFARTDDTVGAVLTTSFEPFRTYRRHGLEFVEGERRDIVTLAFYRLKDGQIHRIRMGRYAGPASDFD